MAASHRSRVLVLASGGGSNLVALLDHLATLGERRAADVVCVASNRADAGALARARERGIAAAAFDAADSGASLAAVADDARADTIVLAGYLKRVPVPLVRRYRGRMLNVHPSLLPSFGGEGMYGRRVHEAVIASGTRVTGATVHFVDEQYDRGPVAAQWPVPVFEEDTPETLAARVLVVEHQLLPRVVEAVAADALAVDDDGRVRGAFLVGPVGEAFALAGGSTLAASLDQALTR